MRPIVVTFVGLILAASSSFAQRGVGRLGGGGNAINPGVPLNGGPVVSGPRFTSGLGAGVTLVNPNSNRPAGSTPFGGFGASLLPPPVAPAFPRGGIGRRGLGFGGGFVGGFYGGGGYVDGFYRSVHNPPPGAYDPIFGVYNPGGGYNSAMEFAPQGPTPSVVINQNFQSEVARPQFRDYSNVPLPEPGSAQLPPPQGAQGAVNVPPGAVQAPAPLPGEQPFYFLIALQDSTIEAAVAYWVTGDTLHYVSLQGQQSSVPLDRVDRTFSRRLNQGRRVGFDLP